MSGFPYKRVLITGGAGFIGSHLAERLAGHCELVLFDNFRRNSLALATSLMSHPEIDIVDGDVLDGESLSRVVKGVDATIHLAAVAGVSSYYSDPVGTLKVNVIGAINVAEAAAAGGCGRFVQASTSEVYGARAENVTEDDSCAIGSPADPRWVYATSKLAAEHGSLRVGEVTGMGVSVIRPFNVYGPRQTGEGAVSNFCRAVTSGRPISVYGDGTATRAWCYVSDIVDGIISVLKTPAAVGEIFNLGNPAAMVSTIELAELFRTLKPGTTIERVEVDRAEVLSRSPNIEKARRILGFSPKVGLSEGLSLTLEAFAKEVPA